MRKRIWGWLSVGMGCVVLVSACGSDGSDSSAGSGACIGELADVAAAFGDCPATLCAAQVWAESCGSLYSGDVTEAGTCDTLRVITIKMGTTHGKDCYYDLASADGEPKLVGAAVYDDTPYCQTSHGASNRIEAGKTTPNCGAFTAGSTVVCDGPGDAPSATAGSGGATSDVPPAACFNTTSHSCGPC